MIRFANGSKIYRSGDESVKYLGYNHTRFTPGLTREFDLRNPDDVRSLFPSLTDAEVAEFVREEEEFATVTSTQTPMVITGVDWATKTVTISRKTN